MILAAGLLAAQYALGVYGHGVYAVGRGHIHGNGVKGGKHTHIGNDGDIVFGVAVAAGGDIHGDVDVEIGLILYHCHGVLGDFFIEHLLALTEGGHYGVKIAYAYAAAAAKAGIMVDICLMGQVILSLQTIKE